MWSRVLILLFVGCINCVSRRSLEVRGITKRNPEETIITSFDLGAVVSGNRMAAAPLGQSLGDGTLDVEGICSKPGMACQDCKLAVTCVSLPIGWLKVPLHKCGDGLTCNAHEGRCSNKTVPECDVSTQKYKHTCEQVGIFPDAYDCRKFHLCSPPEGLPDGRPADHRTALCPRHYGYNPQTGQCSVKLDHGQCKEKPVLDCQSIGHTSVLSSSPNHYYVCLLKRGSLYPQIFICPHGWHFWNGFCRPEPRPTDYENEKEQIEVNTEKKKDSTPSTPPPTTPATTSKIDSFFSTDRVTTYAADSFLADKFDLANYESIDDVAPSIDDFQNSFESEGDFW